MRFRMYFFVLLLNLITVYQLQWTWAKINVTLMVVSWLGAFLNDVFLVDRKAQRLEATARRLGYDLNFHGTKTTIFLALLGILTLGAIISTATMLIYWMFI